MDSITQAVLGASIGEAMLGHKIGKKGAILGAAIATIPDLDVALYLIFDSYDMLRIHRGFSHSILFTILFSFFATYVLQQINWTKTINYSRLWLFSWLSLFTHVLLDTFTSYGTQLLLPFSDLRLGLDSINVVDPVYTVPLIIGLFFSLYWYKESPKKHKPNYIGLILSTAYLLTTLGLKNEVTNNFKNQLIASNISTEFITTIPVGVAGINWYGIARNVDSLYLQKLSLISTQKNSIEAFPINKDLLDLLKPEIANEMKWFAKGNFNVRQEGKEIRIYNLQVDMRGVVYKGIDKYPTAGYFKFSQASNGEMIFSSGSHSTK